MRILRHPGVVMLVTARVWFCHGLRVMHRAVRRGPAVMRVLGRPARSDAAGDCERELHSHRDHCGNGGEPAGSHRAFEFTPPWPASSSSPYPRVHPIRA